VRPAADTQTTIAKSQLDWRSFKGESGLEEELAKANKSGDSWLEKQVCFPANDQAFLERADLRKFELERAQREKQRLNQNK
jgi:hypothetical protein